MFRTRKRRILTQEPLLLKTGYDYIGHRLEGRWTDKGDFPPIGERARPLMASMISERWDESLERGIRMERRSANLAVRQIRTLYTLGTLGGLTDAQLLELFLTRGGDDAEDAFAALVQRHGPMVLGVCRRMLPGSHDAEDSFQATFLILVRRAASIGRRWQLAKWLTSSWQ
jgi:hypothetical protein